MPIEIKRPGEPGGEKPKQSRYTEIFNRMVHALRGRFPKLVFPGTKIERDDSESSDQKKK